MRSPVSSFPLFVLFLALAACAEPGPGGAQDPGAAQLDTDEQRILYVLGHVLGGNIEEAQLSEDEVGSVLQGVRDGALGQEPRVDISEYGPMLQSFMQQRIEASAAAELEAGTAFLEEQAAMEGAVRTDSGIVIEEITPGSGEQPTAESMVEVHYHGTLRDGSVFDSSVERGTPATFPLDGVIPCWTEGLQTMRVGGTSRLVCPPDLAYGMAGRPGIPANSVLVFEVELLDVVEQ